MTPFRKREALQAELSCLKALLQTTPADPLATPMMRGRIRDLEQAIKALGENPPLAPEAELFFTDGPALESEGLEVTFVSEILNSYQNMLTNHYAAKHYGSLRRTGRRRGEDETRLFLSALPLSSLGLQLSQPHVSDFVAAQNVSAALVEISDLVEATAASDQAFEACLEHFDARVFKPLKRFITSIHTRGGTCRLITGNKETPLSLEKISAAYARISAAVTDDEPIIVSGEFGGLIIYSGDFAFQPDVGNVIRGTLAPEITEEQATAMNHDFTKKRAIAKMLMTTVTDRTGKKKPTYELAGLLPIDQPPLLTEEAQAPAPKA